MKTEPMHRFFTAVLPLHLFFLCLLSFSLPGYSISFNSFLDSSDRTDTSEFFPVEEAFQISGSWNDETIAIHFKVTPEHYLYRHMISFQAVKPDLTQLGSPAYPEGITKFDPFMKRDLEIYPEDITIYLPVKTRENFPEIRVHYQGCANAGLCYPPSTTDIIPIQETETSSSAADISNDKKQSKGEIPQDSFLSALLNDSSLLNVLGLFFLGGLALTFTPCVLPMIPIVSAMVAGSQGSRTHNILLTACYVLAMSATYAIAGLLMAYFGAGLNLQARLQSPWLIIPFALIFVLLALSMFGLYELQLPEKLRDFLTRTDQNTSQKRQGTFLGAALAGVISTLLVSPCVSAPLAGALVYISSTGDIILGGSSLFLLGLGMGVPLFIVGAGGASLLPKAGSWMDGIKAIFGVLMLGVAIWMIERIIPQSVTLMLWGTLCIGCAVYLGALHFTKKTGWPAFRQVIGLLFFIYGASLVVGGLQGNTNPLSPLQPKHIQSGKVAFKTITSSLELDDELNQSALTGQPVFIDVYADWCISCKVFEREVLTEPKIIETLQPFTKIKFDLTANSADQRTILQKYGLFGPPAYIFYDSSGQELNFLKKQGEIDSQTLLERLEMTLNQ